MSEQILRILIEELTTIRLTCRQCNTAVELSIATLDNPPTHEARCPGCNGPLRSKRPLALASDVFDKLAEAVRGLKSLHSHEVRFVLPDSKAVASSK